MKKAILLLSLLIVFCGSTFAQSVTKTSIPLAAGGTPFHFVSAKDTLRSGDSLTFVFPVKAGIGTTFIPVMFVTKTTLAADTTIDVTISESFDNVTYRRILYVDTNKVAQMLPTKTIAKGTNTSRYNGSFEDWKFGTLYIKYTFKPKTKAGFKAKLDGYFWYRQQ